MNLPTLIDPILVIELAAVTAAVSQVLKSYPGIKGSTIPWLSGIVGAMVGLLWMLVLGELRGDGFLSVDWADMYRGFFVGIVGSTTANAGYVLQKKLPIPNVLPTASEMSASAAQEVVNDNKIVIEAVKRGAGLEEAKEAVGKDPEDPPPVNPQDKVAADKADAAIDG